MRALLVILAFLVPLAVGCVRVKPYERGIHSRRSMTTADSDKTERKLDGHVEEYREGSIGGAGVGGGGCGCN